MNYKKNILFAILFTFFYCLSADMQAQTIRYVKPDATGDGSSWTNASGNIQEMINLSANGDRIWIAGGNYPIAATLQMKNGVNVYGGFFGDETNINDRPKSDLDTNGTVEAWEFTYSTVLDGQNERQVLNQAANFTTVTTWDGVTITGGMLSSTTASIYGCGVYLRTNGNLINSTITANGGSVQGDYGVYGGGIYSANGTVSHCSVSHNVGDGIYCDYNAQNCTITHCIVENNSGTGISSGNVSNSTVRENNGAGFAYSTASNCLSLRNSGGGAYSGSYTNCSFIENTAETGGGLCGSIAKNCLILRNTATHGGRAGEVRATVPTSGSYTNCTFVDNTATENGGGMDGGTAVNCIFWNNSAPLDMQVTGWSKITFSAIQGEGYLGTSIIVLSPINDKKQKRTLKTTT